MSPGPSLERDSLILIHAPVGRDAHLLHDLLHRAKLQSQVCLSIEQLCDEVEKGAGAISVTEEALELNGVDILAGVLQKQGQWSDLPLVLLTIGGEPTQASRERLERLEPLGDLTLLERPLRSDTIVSAARTALRARAKQYEVRRRDAELQLVTDNVPVLISYLDGAQIYRRVNRTYYEWFGKRPDEIVGRTPKAVIGEPHCAISRPYLARALAGERVSFESRLLDKDRKLRYVNVSYAPDVAPNGDVRGIVELLQDITERARAAAELREREQELRRINAELMRANSELEEFAYVSSHDLQEPLRMVNSYTQLMLKRLGPQADDDLRKFAEYIRTGIRRMEALIRDLLSYSRATHADADATVGTADLGAALRQALHRVDSRIHENHAQVTFDDLPLATGDEGQLSHVFQNLLSNALKYRNESAEPRIHIAAEQMNGNVVVSVRDNGIGFDPSQAERIFGLFKRLHREDEYPGTGLGLAICKRIVERYGGRMWAASEAGRGATFYISLPGANSE